MDPQQERERVAHLLRRFGLGASEAEIDYYGKDGWLGAVDRLLDYASAPEGPVLEPEAFTGKQAGLKPQELRAWWAHRLIATQRPLLEKMTLFWHDHFATSVNKVDNTYLMLNQNETLRSNATGSFRTLLGEVSKDPAMMFWLDNQLNVKGKPNENFAREVMELFTLGIGNYTEKDVQEGARAFTGWNYSQRKNKKGNPNSIKGGRPTFVFNEDDHDAGTKVFLSRTGVFDGDDALDILCDHPQTARFITKKILTWFVGPDPDLATVEAHALKFRQSKLDIRTLLRSIMTSEEFYAKTSVRKLYKSPVDFTVATLRQLGVGSVSAQPDAEGRLPATVMRPVQTVMLATKAMGMELFNPPDVSGWDGGASWISSATMVERIRWADRLFGAISLPGVGKGRTPSLNYPAARLFGSGDPLTIARQLTSIFDVLLPDPKLVAVAETVRRVAGDQVTTETANAAAGAAARLIFGSPEFQFC